MGCEMTFTPLRIEGLSFSYSGQRIFSNFNFQSNEKNVILFGPSGCGKSTLLKLICGFLRPSSIAQFDVGSDHCLVLQEDGLLPWLTGSKNITEFLDISFSEIERHEMFPRVEDLLERKVYAMSYGQRRLIEVFRALLRRPGVLCLDEPMNFLDPASRDIVLEMLVSRDLEGTRMFVVTHHLDEVREFPAERFGFDGRLPVEKLSEERRDQWTQL